MSKGSNRRPSTVAEKELEERWTRAFRPRLFTCTKCGAGPFLNGQLLAHVCKTE